MRYVIFMLLLLLLPLASSIQITEIMYDLEGKDTGYEWIEIYNDATDVDICLYRLFEADTNHYIKGDNCNFHTGEYLVVADRPENLNLDCTVMDSAFSLSNTGERLCIVDTDKVELFCVEYLSDWGASGDGSSLQLVDEEWCAGAPTPGEQNLCGESAEQVEVILEPEDPINYEPEVKDLPDKSTVGGADEVSGGGSSGGTAQSAEPDPVKEPEILPIQETAPAATSSVVYESRAESVSNLSILLLLTVSITLNVVFIISKIR